MQRALIISFNYSADDHSPLDEWYNREHIPERVQGIAGFMRARRFVAVDGMPQYLTVYDIADAAVLSSPDYVALLERPDRRTREHTSRFKDVAKTVMKTRAMSGSASGPYLRVFVFDGARGDISPADPRVADLMQGLLSRQDVVAARLLEADGEIMRTVKRVPTRRNDGAWPWALLIEATSDKALSALSPDRLLDAIASTDGGAKQIANGMFRLSMSSQKQ